MNTSYFAANRCTTQKLCVIEVVERIINDWNTVLSVLEVDEYSSISELGDTPATLSLTEWPFYSFHSHSLIATSITAYIRIFRDDLPPNLRDGLEQLPFVGAFFLISLVSESLRTSCISIY